MSNPLTAEERAAISRCREELSLIRPPLLDEDAAVQLVCDACERLAQENARLTADVQKWRRIRTPTHGSCCTCQACGQFYDDCRCDLDEVADRASQAEARCRELAQALLKARRVMASSTAHHQEVDALLAQSWVKALLPEEPR